ncbi:MULTISPECIES: transposase-like zinc-binding domain-containing protein [Alistipes]
MTCKFCGGTCIKNGYQANGKQRYKCNTAIGNNRRIILTKPISRN